MPDLFSQLLPLTWKGLGLPWRSIATEGAQDVVEHKRVDRDGARLEGTGRAPYPFKVEIPFINGIQAAGGETWDSANLFPGLFTQFIAACEDRSSGPFQHPVAGVITAKCLAWPYNLTAEERGGVTVHATFKESTETTAATELGAATPFAAASDAAAALDSIVPNLQPPPPDPLLGDSFSDFLLSIQESISSAELSISQFTAQVTRVVGALDVIASTPSYPPAAVDAASTLAFSLRQIKQTAVSQTRRVAFYTTPARTTLGALAQILGADIVDLLKLNDQLLGSVVVPAQTTVVYYP